MKANSYRVAGLATVLVAVAAACSLGDASRDSTGDGFLARVLGQEQSSQALSSPNAPARAHGQAPMAMAPQLAMAGRAPGESFASLPDRGDLVAYPQARVVRHAGPYTWHRADISEAHAIGAIAAGVLTITAPSGQLLRFAYDRHVEHASGDWTWIGHAVGGSVAEDAILTFGPSAVFGTIAQTGAAPLKLEMEDGASWLVETDRDALTAQNRAAGRHDTPDFLLPPDLPVVESIKAQSAAVRASSSVATTTSTTVDVVIGYTTGFETANKVLNNLSPVLSRLNFLVDVANESYVNSNVAVRARLVHALKVDYQDNNGNSDALRALTGSDGETTPTLGAVDPALQPLHAARDQYGADLVSLVRDFQHPEAVSCGVAWLLGGGQSNLHAGYHTYGMSVVSDGADGGYFCEETTFAHELGHNMGLAHDVDTAKGENGVLDEDDYGRYPYSFGLRTGFADGSFYTVMAYSDDQENEYRVFSNPDITICGGFPCGVADKSDNARTLRQTAPIIATFRATVVPEEPEPEIRIERDVNGDGRADLLWFNPAVGRVQAWEMNGAAWNYGSVHDLGTDRYRVAGVGDFNGDGQGDLLWKDQAGTELWTWLATPSGVYQVVYLRAFPAGWKIAGVADVNADGREDIFWYNASLGMTQVWYMNGSTWTYGPVAGVPPNTFDIAGIADFSGDGRADVIWHDNARTQLWLWAAQADGSFTVHFLRDYPAGWSVVGTGDANDDGRKDVFWHNPTAGVLQTWLMNGAAWTYGQPFGIASQYRVGAIEDFNGDGKVDIMWHDDAHAWLWLANDFAYGVNYLRSFPVGWQVANRPFAAP